MPVPAGEAAALYEHFVAIRIFQKIMKDEAGLRVFPSSHLTEAEVVEDCRITPSFYRIKAMRKPEQIVRIRFITEGVQQGGIAGLVAKLYRLRVEHRTIPAIKSIAVRRNDIP